MIALLSIPVLVYQLAFVGILVLASRFGPVWLHIALAACLLWTATHVFLPPLAVLQASVILTTYFLLRRRRGRRGTTGALPPPN